jgi:hypothetical protein
MLETIFSDLDGREEPMPQGLKPACLLVFGGTTEVVPFQDRHDDTGLGAVLRKLGTLLGGLLGVGAVLAAQPTNIPTPQLNVSGQVMLDGRAAQYVIRHLPVSSFAQLPVAVAKALDERGCMIPQTYQAHRPENVIEASLERPGSRDWAVLCSAGGTVSLMVFFGSAVEGGVAKAQVIESAMETERLQAHGGVGGVLGFNWGIDPATPEQVHEAQAGMDRRPARVDHDALADTLVDHHTVYHFYTKGAWVVLAMPE